jgi:hypothetical protein
MRITCNIQHLYRSRITLKSGHPNATSGDRAAYREFDRVLLQLTERVLSEETIEKERRTVAIRGSISDES